MNLRELLGAAEEPSAQILTLYIASRDRNGKAVKNIRKWIKEAEEILSSIGGGSTSMPPADGTWLNRETGKLVRENTTLIYTFIDPDRLVENMGRLRKFLHNYGRETNQGEVAAEFDGKFYKIRAYDRER